MTQQIVDTATTRVRSSMSRQHLPRLEPARGARHEPHLDAVQAPPHHPGQRDRGIVELEHEDVVALLELRALGRDLDPLRRALDERDVVGGAAEHPREGRARVVTHLCVLQVHVEAARGRAIGERRVVAVERGSRRSREQARRAPVEVSQARVESGELGAEVCGGQSGHGDTDTIRG